MTVQRLWVSTLIPILFSLILCSNLAQAKSLPSEANLERLAQAYDRMAHVSELDAQKAELCTEAHWEHAELFEQAASLRFRTHWFRDRNRSGERQTMEGVYGQLAEFERNDSENCLNETVRSRESAERDRSKADSLRRGIQVVIHIDAATHRQFAEVFRMTENSFAVAGHDSERAEKYRDQAKMHRRRGETEYAELAASLAAVSERLAAIKIIETGIDVYQAASMTNFAAALD